VILLGMEASSEPSLSTRSNPIVIGKASSADRLWTIRRELHGRRIADDSVYIGDLYRIGSALFEVTQPRVTCYPRRHSYE